MIHPSDSGDNPHFCCTCPNVLSLALVSLSTKHRRREWINILQDSVFEGEQGYHQGPTPFNLGSFELALSGGKRKYELGNKFVLYNELVTSIAVIVYAWDMGFHWYVSGTCVFVSQRRTQLESISYFTPSPLPPFPQLPSPHVETQKEWLNQEGERRAFGTWGMVILEVCIHAVYSAFF